MIAPRYVPFVLRHVVRYRLRSLLTIGGIAMAMFLFVGVRALQQGVREATVSTGSENTLVVYRENRYCPFSSKLPQDYARRIAQIPGVEQVVPVQIMVGNCRASLDVITFRGIPREQLEQAALRGVTLTAGSVADWQRRTDSALIGHRVAKRRGLSVGDRLEIAGVTIAVAGIFKSPKPQDQEAAFVHLPFLQRSSGLGLGTVTQFNVSVQDPTQLDAVAAQIDEAFAAAQEPTSTWNEKAFAARAVADIVELAGFASWLGWGALAAVFALVINAIILSVQDRIRDHAILQTLGYRGELIARLIIAESAILAVAGGLVGIGAAAGTLHWGKFAMSVEGLSVQANIASETVGLGLATCLVLGIVAGLFPAWQAGRREIAGCFRAV